MYQMRSWWIPFHFIGWQGIEGVWDVGGIKHRSIEKTMFMKLTCFEFDEMTRRRKELLYVHNFANWWKYYVSILRWLLVDEWGGLKETENIQFIDKKARLKRRELVKKSWRKKFVTPFGFDSLIPSFSHPEISQRSFPPEIHSLILSYNKFSFCLFSFLYLTFSSWIFFQIKIRFIKTWTCYRFYYVRT